MARRPRTQRRRRIAGTFRFHERRGPDPGQEEQRLSLFLPAEVLDRAAEQAARVGRSVQEYCGDLLQNAVEEAAIRHRVEEEEARRGPLEGLQAIAADPEYLVEWKASAQPDRSRFRVRRDSPRFATLDDPSATVMEPEPGPGSESDGSTSVEPATAGPVPESLPMLDRINPVAEIILRHAGLGSYEDPAGLLPSLRRGESIGPASAREILAALDALEKALRASDVLDRRLAYALHRLAFEGQVLLTDGWSSRAADAATVDVLHLVQEGVDRVLSGEDIRYYPRDDVSGASP